MKKTMKRILSVTVRKHVDTDPSLDGSYSDSPESKYSIDRFHSLDCASIEVNHREAMDKCDCSGNKDSYHSFRYFNPPYENYEGCTEEEIRKYCLQDYQRMEDLNDGKWHYLVISAEADYIVGTGSTVQTMKSGSLFGVESDSDPSYIEEVEKEQLAELREQLLATGFRRRAVSKAFQNITRVGE